MLRRTIDQEYLHKYLLRFISIAYIAPSFDSLNESGQLTVFYFPQQFCKKIPSRIKRNGIILSKHLPSHQ